jgi:hypothetical protein
MVVMLHRRQVSVSSLMLGRNKASYVDVRNALVG